LAAERKALTIGIDEVPAKLVEVNEPEIVASGSVCAAIAAELHSGRLDNDDRTDPLWRSNFI